MIFSTSRLHPEAKRAMDGLGLVEASADERTLARCIALLARPSEIDCSVLARMASLKAIQTISAGGWGPRRR